MLARLAQHLVSSARSAARLGTGQTSGITADFWQAAGSQVTQTRWGIMRASTSQASYKHRLIATQHVAKAPTGTWGTAAPRASSQPASPAPGPQYSNSLKTQQNPALPECRPADFPLDPPSVPSALRARELHRNSLPRTLIRVAGVSFDNRQAAVASLQADDAVMLVREPGNPHDSNAVCVQRLDGRQLGYVPKELTRHFSQYTTFGHVHSSGQIPGSFYGCEVGVRPALPALTVEAVPPSLRGAVQLSAHLHPSQWDRISHATLRAANFRCQVTGGAGSQTPVLCQEVWAADEARCKLRLLGFMALAPEVHAAKRILSCRPQQYQPAIWTLQAINEWSRQETESYLTYIAAKAQERSKKQWRLDLSYLDSQGIPIPAALQMHTFAVTENV